MLVFLTCQQANPELVQRVRAHIAQHGSLRDLLDDRAKFPEDVARSLIDIALRCVHAQWTERFSIKQVLLLLQSLADKHVCLSQIGKYWDY